MDKLENSFHQIVITDEHAEVFICLLYHSLIQDSLESLESDSPLGPAQGPENGPVVFWGVPRLSPGFVGFISATGHEPNEHSTLAQVKQTLQVQGAGLFLKQLTGSVDRKKSPVNPDSEDVWFECDMKFASTGAGDVKNAFIRVEVSPRRVNYLEFHYSVKTIVLQWH